MNKFTAIAALLLIPACSAGSAEPMSEAEDFGGEVAETETTDAPKAQASGELITSIDLGDNSKVEFYRLPGGSTAVGEIGSIGQDSVLEAMGLESATQIEIFSALQPGLEIPAALIEAERLQQLAEPEAPEVEEAAAAHDAAREAEQAALRAELNAAQGELGSTQQAVTSDEFLEKGCSCGAHNVLVSCEPKRNGVVYEKSAKVERTNVRIGHESGNGIRLLGYESDKWVLDVFVPKGKWAKYTLSAPKNFFGAFLKRTFRWTTSEVSGDKYHAASCWYIY